MPIAALRRVFAVAAGVSVVVLAAGAGPSGARGASCGAPRVSMGYERTVTRALAAKRDVWGERLLAARGGPTAEAARAFLAPLLYARGPRGRSLTASGVYYLPFSLPTNIGGERGFALHVADGSQIVTRRAGGPTVTVFVGARGSERFGACLARLAPARLAEGYLPILQTAYRDAGGSRFTQESFAGRLPDSRSLVSFVRVGVEPGSAGTVVRFAASDGGGLRYAVSAGTPRDVYVAWNHDRRRVQAIDAATYAAARAAVVAFWAQQLSAGATFDVPEPAVADAERGLLVQQLSMTWRYSVGNTYEELSYAEALDVAQVLAAYGYGDISRQILRFALRRLPVRFTNWRAGERLESGAMYYRLHRDRRYVEEELPELARVVDVLASEQASSRTGLLPRERYSSDIADRVYSLQGQTLVWQGLQDMARIWAATGHPQLASRARSIAARLRVGLAAAVRASQRRLPDGSLFVPAALLDGGAPYERLTASRDGTYWNLVAPFALASGFFAPDGSQARGLLRYVLSHGSRLLGLVRAGAYRLSASGHDPAAGIDQVYGVNMSRFLADVDRPDQLVLSLYGMLAASMTPGTYVTGEAGSVAPLGGLRYRSMYLPPNGDGNAAFLETLRVMLVHETRARDGAPRGLELAFATPRSWLADGKTIAVRNAPTSFGPLSYSIARSGSVVHVRVDAPPSASLRLRLRLPAGERIVSVRAAGGPLRFDARGTIDLTGRSGPLELDAAVGSL